jgi:hypothetical protein
MVILVEETFVAVILAVSIAVEAERFVEETFVAVTFAVSMEVAAVMRVEERFVAERLLPVAFTKARLVIVEDAVLNSVEEATPALLIWNVTRPEDKATWNISAVCPAMPCSRAVVVPTLVV